MADAPFIVDRQASLIQITGQGVPDTIDQGGWIAARIDSGRMLLTSVISGSAPEKAEGFARFSIDVLHDMLIGFAHRKWTGVVAVDTGFGLKKLYFNHGNLTFAGSSLIDDRLGEVIYREAMISLDQLTESAVQVDRSTKFGQVLLKDKIFSNTDLWVALKNQVREIFRSVFLGADVYVEILKESPPTEVTFEEGSENLINAAYSAGLQFRSFYRRLRRNSTIQVKNSDAVVNLKSGTFVADMVQLAQKYATVGDLLDISKLTDINTLWVLNRMSCLGLITFAGLQDAQHGNFDGAFANLNLKVETISKTVELILEAFAVRGAVLPVVEIQNFAWALNDGNLAAIYIDDQGRLGGDCIVNMMAQCEGNRGRISYFEDRIDSLIRFYLQVAGDLLPFDETKKIRAKFAEFSA
ncbi:MAG: hypothetical protein NTV34_13170 [Proteobacteria bacterium]|nr:hypothetical protein [Pseudomonadota bacterium]